MINWFGHPRYKLSFPPGADRRESHEEMKKVKIKINLSYVFYAAGFLKNKDFLFMKENKPIRDFVFPLLEGNRKNMIIDNCSAYWYRWQS